jgi:hypothetical protein
VQVDEPGGDGETRRIDHTMGIGGDIADLDDSSVPNADIGSNGGSTRAVDDSATLDHDIELWHRTSLVTIGSRLQTVSDASIYQTPRGRGVRGRLDPKSDQVFAKLSIR